jgi:hypothetical protein
MLRSHSTSQTLQFPEEWVTRSKASASLPINPHRDREQQDENVQATNDREYLQRALVGYPRTNEIVHAKGIDVAQIQGCKCLWSLVTMALRQITKDARCQVS